MRIGFIGNFSENLVDGVSVSTYILAKELVHLDHEIYFLSISNLNRSRTNEDGIIVKEFKSRSRQAQSLKNYLSTNKDSIDIFWIKSVFIPSNYLIFRYLKSNNYSYIMTPHGGYDPHVFKRGRLKKNIFYHLFDRKIIKNATGLICISPREYDELSKLNRNSILIPDPIITNSRIATTSQKTTTLVYLGRLDIEHKGLLKLLDIFYHIQRLDNQVHLKLYGEGPGKSKLEKIIQKYKLKNCDIISPIFGEQKKEVLSGAALYVQTSKWETFGRSIFEALSVGTPVAISRNCDYSEHITNYKAGVILDPEPQKASIQIIELLSNKSLLNTYGKNGISLTSSEFESNLIAQKTVRFLLNIAVKK